MWTQSWQERCLCQQAASWMCSVGRKWWRKLEDLGGSYTSGGGWPRMADSKWFMILEKHGRSLQTWSRWVQVTKASQNRNASLATSTHVSSHLTLFSPSKCAIVNTIHRYLAQCHGQFDTLFFLFSYRICGCLICVVLKQLCSLWQYYSNLYWDLVKTAIGWYNLNYRSFLIIEQ